MLWLREKAREESGRKPCRLAGRHKRRQVPSMQAPVIRSRGHPHVINSFTFQTSLRSPTCEYSRATVQSRCFKSITSFAGFNGLGDCNSALSGPVGYCRGGRRWHVQKGMDISLPVLSTCNKSCPQRVKRRHDYRPSQHRSAREMPHLKDPNSSAS